MLPLPIPLLVPTTWRRTVLFAAVVVLVSITAVSGAQGFEQDAVRRGGSRVAASTPIREQGREATTTQTVLALASMVGDGRISSTRTVLRRLEDGAAEEEQEDEEQADEEEAVEEEEGMEEEQDAAEAVDDDDYYQVDTHDDDFYQADTQDDGENWENEQYANQDRQVADDVIWYDDQYTDDDRLKKAEKITRDNLLDMFEKAPRNWNPYQCFLFTVLMFLHGLFFLCCCMICVIPYCCQKSASEATYDAMSHY